MHYLLNMGGGGKPLKLTWRTLLLALAIAAGLAVMVAAGWMADSSGW